MEVAVGKRSIALIITLLIVALAMPAYAVVIDDGGDVDGVIIRVIDSQGDPIEGVRVQYQAASWYEAGDSDHNGEVLVSIPERFSTITARAHYHGGRVDIRQNIRENPEIEFQTVRTTVMLQDSDSKPLEGGRIQYVYSSWAEFGVTDSTGEAAMELLPTTYTFRMSYAEGRVDIKQNIGDNPVVLFQTVPVTVRLEDSEGTGLEGGKIIYVRAGWQDYGVTGEDGNAHRELLSGTYTFRMSYAEGRVDIKQNISENPVVLFQTVPVTVRLEDSEGTGLEGGKIIYVRAGWQDYGVTGEDGNAHRELLSGTYTFRMSYAEGRVDIKQNISENPVVLFQTVPVTVRLEDSEGTGLEGGKIIYVRAGWQDYGVTGDDGNAHRELLSGTYTFRMSYAEGRVDIKQNISDNPVVLFQTVPVTVRLEDSEGTGLEGGRVRYVRASWQDFGFTQSDGNALKELLIGTYTFRMYVDKSYENQKANINGATLITFITDVAPEPPDPPVETYTLSVNVVPEASGSVTVSPDKARYDAGEIVTFTVSPVDGYQFSSYGGSNGSEVNANRLTMDGDKSVTVQLEEIGSGEPTTIIVHNVDELNDAENVARNGNVTILLDDGTYELSDQFMVRGVNVTVRSLNGDASKVIVRGNGMDGSVPHVFSVYSDQFTVEDLTLGWVRNHGIQVHGELDADDVVIRNVHFRDTREQMLKISYSTSQPDFSDNGLVEGCSFLYTAGIGPQWYIGGVDGHRTKGWVVRNCLFQDIVSPESGLSEGAIHFWSDATDSLVENNLIVNCDRGVMFGLDSAHHYGGVVRNNFIHTTRDVGIYMANAHDTRIYNNTVFIDSDYFNAIEYRFAESHVYLTNNLTNKPMASRNGGMATLMTNIDFATDTWFVQPHIGDLHLADAIYDVMDQGSDVAGLTRDIDGDLREPGAVDIGADEADFEIRMIASINTVIDKREIVSNGKDGVTITAWATYVDGSQEEMIPDTITVTDAAGNSRILPSARFTSFVTGEFTIVCSAQDVTGSSAIVTVVEEDLSESQVSNIALLHREGQIFVTFEEIVQIVDDPEIQYKQLYALKDAYPRTIQYRIYASDTPITEADLSSLTPVGSVDMLSGWNLDLYGISTQYKENVAVRYVIEDLGAPLGLSQGLFVTNPPETGLRWYAVTAVVDGVENTNIVENENMMAIYNETVGQGTPVLQRIAFDDNFQWVYNVELHLYTRWEGPPNCSVMGKPYDYLIGKPQNMASPAPVGIHMHCWGGNLYGGYGWWNDAEDGALILASNQYPYDWWTGYHEDYYDASVSKSSWGTSGVVRPYSTTRLISFLDWMEESGEWVIDRPRTFVAGSSMGGSGSLMMAIRYPELISWCRSWVGVHVPEKSPNFKSSYQSVYGKPEYGVLFESFDPENSDNGTPVWDYYNDVWYLDNHVEKSIGFLSFCNGKNDNAIGWEQAVDFVNALQRTRQPHLFIWGQGGHSQRTVLPKNGSERHMVIDARNDQSLPAFTRCTLDNLYGNGDPEDGDSAGQVNRYLYWETDDLVDTVDQWEISVALMDTAPGESCQVDITPRRLQNFYVMPGVVVGYINIDVNSGEVVDSGEVMTDEYGLVTIPQTVVSQGGNRIVVAL